MPLTSMAPCVYCRKPTTRFIKRHHPILDKDDLIYECDLCAKESEIMMDGSFTSFPDAKYLVRTLDGRYVISDDDHVLVITCIRDEGFATFEEAKRAAELIHSKLSIGCEVFTMASLYKSTGKEG